MKNNFDLFWLIPAIAIVGPMVVILMVAHSPFSLGHAPDVIYTAMLLFGPVAGAGVLLSLLCLLIFQRPLLRRINLLRTIPLAFVSLISPLIFLVVAFVMSGFTR